MIKLDYTEGFLPLYSQIAYDICRRIVQNEFIVGDCIPSQNELSKEYNVSRITIIKALKFLSDRGILQTSQGKCSKILKSDIGFNSYVEEGFVNQFKRYGFNVHTKVITSQIVEVAEFVASKLGVEIGEDVVELKRIRFLNSTPVCYEHTFYRAEDPIKEICLHLKDDESLYAKLRNKNIFPSYAEENMCAISSTADISSILSTGTGSPVLRVTRCTFASNMNTPFEFCINYYNTEVYGDYGVVKINLKQKASD